MHLNEGGQPLESLRGRTPMLATFVVDLKHGMRTLRRNAAYSLVAVLTLALGIGANTAVLSFLNGVLLEPLPFADADRLVVLWTANAARGIAEEGTSYPTVRDWSALNHSFSDIAITTRGKQVL